MLKLIKTVLNIRLVRYLIIGGTSTLIHITAAFLFICCFYPSNLFSNIFGFSHAFFFSYIFQSKFVFDSSLSFHKASKYFLVQFLSLLFAIGLTNILSNVNLYIRVLLVVVILPLITFFAHKVWTFAQHESKN